MSQAIGPVEPRDTPYFGLDYFEEKFGAWFFGRETETSKVVTNLRAARLTLLHADSGVGKSSLLRAGVAWRMHGLAADCLARRGTAGSLPIVFASWKDDPVLELIDAIRMGIGPYLAGRPLPELGSDRLDVAIATASDTVNASLLIMLDQFEEYFVYRAREPIPGRFVDEVARCVNRADLRANFLIAIREEAYAGLGDLFKGRTANVYGNYLHIEYLDRTSAEKAIRNPLDVYNRQPGVRSVTIQDELVAAVLHQVRAIDRDVPLDGAIARHDHGRVATPLLQLVMQTLWEKERAAGSHELRLSTLRDLRGVEVIVEAHLGKALDALGKGERQTAVDVFGHLTTLSGGKIAESVPDLARVTGHSESQVGGLLDRLDHERIVRPVAAAPGRDPVRYRRYEIFNDVLTSAISRMITLHEEQRRTRRLRRFTTLVTALLMVVLAIAAGFALLWQNAHNEYARAANASARAANARSRLFVAEADAALESNPKLSAQLAWKAVDWQVTPQAQAALRAALPEVQEVRASPVRMAVSAVFDPVDANKVLSASQSGLAWIWNVKTGHRLVSFPAGGFRDVGHVATSAVFNPAGTEVAVGYDNGAAVFDVSSGRELHAINLREVSGSTLKGVRGPNLKEVNALQFVGRTGQLAIATQNGLEVCRPPYGLKDCQLLSRASAFAIAVASHNPREIAVLGDEGKEAIWNVGKSGRLLPPLVLPGPVHRDADFSPDGSEIATADTDGAVRVYHFATLHPVLMMTLGAGEPITSNVAFSPDGRLIVAGYLSGKARVWDTSTRLQLTTLAGSTVGVEAVNFSPDGSEAVTVNDDGTANVFDARPQELRSVFPTLTAGGRPAPVDAASYIGGGRVFALDTSEHGYVLTTGGKPQAVFNPGAEVVWAAWNQAGTKIVTAEMVAYQTGWVDVWQAIGAHFTRVHLRTPIRFGQVVSRLSMSRDGSRIAVVTPDGRTIQVRSAQTGQLLETLGSDQRISVMAFSPAGRQILVGDNNGQVEAWDLPAGSLVLHKPVIGITDAEYDRSGREFVTLTRGGSVALWDARDDQLLHQFRTCPAPLSVSLSPDDKKVAVPCEDGSVGVFDAATGQLLTELPATSGMVWTASFSPDGKSIITAEAAGPSAGGVEIWSAQLANPSLSAVKRMAERLINP